MADQKITQLTALASAASTDVLPIVDVANTETKKITKADLLNGLQAELVSGTNIKTINSTSLLGSGDISLTTSAAGTSGQIQFNDSSAFGADSNLFWDNTNKRLGVGTNSPTQRLEVNGNFQLHGNDNSGSVALGLTFRPNINLPAYGPSIYSYYNNDRWLQIYKGSQVYTFGDSGLLLSSVSQIPTARLHIKGSGSTSATTSLLVQNSSGNDALKVRDDRVVIMEGLPTSSSGLPSGALWNDSGTLKIV
jgi:hypothetical protein